MARNDTRTFTVEPGQWLVLIAQEDGFPTVLSVEADQEQALAWRDELVRRVVAAPEVGVVLTEASGRVFLALRASIPSGSPITGPRELLVLRVDGHLPPLPHVSAHLHRLLPGRFPA